MYPFTTRSVVPHCGATLRVASATGIFPHMSIKLGESVGDFTFHIPDGSPFSLGERLGQPLLLVFLRHLA